MLCVACDAVSAAYACHAHLVQLRARGAAAQMLRYQIIARLWHTHLNLATNPYEWIQPQHCHRTPVDARDRGRPARTPGAERVCLIDATVVAGGTVIKLVALTDPNDGNHQRRVRSARPGAARSAAAGGAHAAVQEFSAR
eukprot:SAG31_NODE_769_length_12212_cov_5.357508_1_plen_140_part_00